MNFVWVLFSNIGLKQKIWLKWFLMHEINQCYDLPTTQTNTKEPFLKIRLCFFGPTITFGALIFPSSELRYWVVKKKPSQSFPINQFQSCKHVAIKNLFDFYMHLFDYCLLQLYLQHDTISWRTDNVPAPTKEIRKTRRIASNSQLKITNHIHRQSFAAFIWCLIEKGSHSLSLNDGL